MLAGMKSLPSKLEISPTDGLDLDEAYAMKVFFGKTLDEARVLMSECDYCSEELASMGPVAFAYYGQVLPSLIQKDLEEQPTDDYIATMIKTLIYCRELWPVNRGASSCAIYAELASLLVAHFECMLEHYDELACDEPMMIAPKKIERQIAYWRKQQTQYAP